MPDAETTQPGRLDLHRFLRSVLPALDLAFAPEPDDTLPEPLNALVARLEAGPLGEGADRAAALESA